MKGESKLIFKHEPYHTNLRVLYTELRHIAFIGNVRSAGDARVRGNRDVRENIAKQCVHK